MFEGRDITGESVTDVCQLGLTKSYQINRLFDRLTVLRNLTIAALGDTRGKFKLDLFRSMAKVLGLDEQVKRTAALVNLTSRLDTPVSELAYGKKRRRAMPLLHDLFPLCGRASGTDGECDPAMVQPNKRLHVLFNDGVARDLADKGKFEDALTTVRNADEVGHGHQLPMLRTPTSISPSRSRP